MNYLVTGGTGFLGKELLKRIVSNNRVTVVARNEGKLLELKQQFPSIHILAGDISDPFVARQACKDVDGVFHLAGFKHVGLAEKQPYECYMTNVVGSFNILNYSNKAAFVVGISTDKACRVSGVYGASKLIMERLFDQFKTMNPGTGYKVVRYGNVLYSTGSVLCRWREAIINNQEITVTDPNSTRFYWTVSEAVDLIFYSLGTQDHEMLIVPEMKSMQLRDLLDAMILKYNNSYNTLNIKVIGLQPGENQHEQIASWLPSSDVAERFTVEEITKLI